MTQNPPEFFTCPICSARANEPIKHLWVAHRRLLDSGQDFGFSPRCPACHETFPWHEVDLQRQHLESCEPLRLLLAQTLILKATK